MDQKKITCSFCSSQFMFPLGLGMREAICPQCGKAMPLFTQSLSSGEAEGSRRARGFDDEWDLPEEREAPRPREPLARIALSQVPASQRGAFRGDTGTQASSPAAKAKAGQGRMMQDLEEPGAEPFVEESEGPSGPGPLPGKRALLAGFDLELEEPSPPEGHDPGSDNAAVLAPELDEWPEGATPLEPLQNPHKKEKKQTNPPELLEYIDELDMEDEIPEAAALVMPESAQAPSAPPRPSRAASPAPASGGPRLADEGIQVTIPETPIEERQRYHAVAVNTKEPAGPSGRPGMAAATPSPPRAGSSTTMRPLLLVAVGVLVLMVGAVLFLLLS